MKHSNAIKQMLADYIVGDVPGKIGYVAIGFSILLFDIATYGISYYLEKRETDILNEKLKANREKRQDL